MKISKDAIISYISCLTILFLFLFVYTRIIYNKTNKRVENDIITSNINYNDDSTNINVKYPRFKNDIIDSITTNILYSYIREFKNNEGNKYLNISYQLFYFKEYVNITFYIDNSLSIIKNKNIIINLNKKELAYITSFYDEDIIRNEILNLVKRKYSKEVYDKVEKSSINNFTYILNKNKIEVYFNNIVFNDLNYIPFVKIISDDILKSLK